MGVIHESNSKWSKCKGRFRGAAWGAEAPLPKFSRLKASRSCNTGAIAFYLHCMGNEKLKITRTIANSF